MAHSKICSTIFKHYKEVLIMPPREIRIPLIPKPRYDLFNKRLNLFQNDVT